MQTGEIQVKRCYNLPPYYQYMFAYYMDKKQGRTRSSLPGTHQGDFLLMKLGHNYSLGTHLQSLHLQRKFSQTRTKTHLYTNRKGHLSFRAQAHKHTLKTKISHIMHSQRSWLVHASLSLLKQEGKQSMNKRTSNTNQNFLGLIGQQN